MASVLFCEGTIDEFRMSKSSMIIEMRRLSAYADKHCFFLVGLLENMIDFCCLKTSHNLYYLCLSAYADKQVRLDCFEKERLTN